MYVFPPQHFDVVMEVDRAYVWGERVMEVPLIPNPLGATASATCLINRCQGKPWAWAVWGFQVGENKENKMSVTDSAQQSVYN